MKKHGKLQSLENRESTKLENLELENLLSVFVKKRSEYAEL